MLFFFFSKEVVLFVCLFGFCFWFCLALFLLSSSPKESLPIPLRPSEISEGICHPLSRPLQ